MAHIRKTDYGSYEAFIDMGKDPSTGKRARYTKTFSTSKEAKNWVAEKTKERTIGIASNSSNYSVRNYLIKWLKDYAEPNLSPTTYDGYEMIVKSHIIPTLGALKLKELKPFHIQEYQSLKLKSGRKDDREGGLSKKTILQHHRILSKALKQAVLWQLIAYNPASAVPAPSPDKPEIQAMSPKEIDGLLSVTEGEWIYPLLYIAISTGMRRGELLGLRWKDVNTRNHMISVRQTLVKANNKKIFKCPKTKSSIRTIEIYEDDIEVLKNLRKKQVENQLLFGQEYNQNNLVFCDEDGSTPNPDTVTKRFKAVAKKVNLSQYRLHDLRHTHASLMLEAGVQMKVIQERLGHSNITTTMDTYAHLQPNMQKNAVAKFKKHINK